MEKFSPPIVIILITFTVAWWLTSCGTVVMIFEWWPDGFVQWLLFQVLCDLGLEGGRVCRVTRVVGLNTCVIVTTSVTLGRGVGPM